MPILDINKLNEHSYAIIGELSFATINKQTLSALDLSIPKQTLRIDLDQIRKIDSAGLALLIEWLKLSRRKQIDIHYLNAPKQLKALADLSYLSEFDLFTTFKEEPDHNG